MYQNVQAPDGRAHAVSIERLRVLGSFENHAQAIAACQGLPDGTDIIMEDVDDVLGKYTPVEICAVRASVLDLLYPNKAPNRPSPGTGRQEAQELVGLLRQLPNRNPKRKEGMTEETKTKTRTKGNTARVHEICDELYQEVGTDITRGMVIEKGREEGIPDGTLSTQWQKWRKAAIEAGA